MGTFEGNKKGDWRDIKKLINLHFLYYSFYLFLTYPFISSLSN